MTPYQRWRPEFAKAIEGPLYDIDYLDYLVLGTRHAQLWTGDEAAIVTAFRYFPNRVVAIEGLVAAGDLDEIRNRLIPAAEEWGRLQGCAFAMIASREGWVRALKNDGYEPHQITLIKEL